MIARLRDWGLRHPRLADAVLAGALAAVAAPDLMDALEEPGAPNAGASPVLGWIVLAGLVVPLAWRRRAPLAVFAIIAAVAFAQWLTVPPFGGDAALLVALYTVAAHERRRWPVAAATAILALGAALVLLTLPDDSDRLLSALSLAALIASAVLLGVFVRTRRRQIAEVERERIAREMHDIVAHGLAVMTALADGAQLAIRTDPGEAEQALRHISDTGRRAQAEMRRLLGVLGDDAPASTEPQPGLEQLDALLERFRGAGLAATLTVSGDPVPVADGVELTAYRVVQEALTNTLRHAPSASAADVRLHYGAGALDVVVRDDGAGAPAKAVGHGLAGLRRRAALHGADLVAGPHPGGGWLVQARLPLDA